MTHTINPLRPARTLCGRLPGSTSVEWTSAASCSRCERAALRLRAAGPELVAYWSGSISSSVAAAVDAGLATVVLV